MAKSRNTALLKKVAARIKQLREKRGITQEVFLNDTGINIGRIERAERDISMSTLSSICSYLEIPLNDFFKSFKD